MLYCALFALDLLEYLPTARVESVRRMSKGWNVFRLTLAHLSISTALREGFVVCHCKLSIHATKLSRFDLNSHQLIENTSLLAFSYKMVIWMYTKNTFFNRWHHSWVHVYEFHTVTKANIMCVRRMSTDLVVASEVIILYRSESLCKI